VGGEADQPCPLEIVDGERVAVRKQAKLVPPAQLVGGFAPSAG